MNESEKQFSFTRAALSKNGAARRQFLVNMNLRKIVVPAFLLLSVPALSRAELIYENPGPMDVTSSHSLYASYGNWWLYDDFILSDPSVIRSAWFRGYVNLPCGDFQFDITENANGPPERCSLASI